jgi:hypothetical protein
MSKKTVITKQLYNLRGNKKTNGTYTVSVINTLDENQDECACSLIDKEGEKSFVIIKKNDDLNIGQEAADMTYGGKPVLNVSYIKSDDCNTWFERYVTGNQDFEHQSFFEAVQKRIAREFVFRGLSIDDEGVLTIEKPEYFY